MNSDRYYIADVIFVISYSHYRCRTEDFIFRIEYIDEFPDTIFYAHTGFQPESGQFLYISSLFNDHSVCY